MNVAKIVHQANKAYCEELEDFSQVNWEHADNDIRRSATMGVQNVIDNPGLTAKDSHDSWFKQKEADGWVYGKTKDSGNKVHPCMVPFEDLPEAQQVKDKLFIAIVQAVLGAPEGNDELKGLVADLEERTTELNNSLDLLSSLEADLAEAKEQHTRDLEVIANLTPKNTGKKGPNKS